MSPSACLALLTAALLAQAQGPARPPGASGAAPAPGPARAPAAAPAPGPARAPAAAPAPEAVDDATFARAREHYAQAEDLFNEGSKDQALEHFRLSYELSGNVEALFGMAQSEYHVGRLRDARTHYQRYLDSPDRREKNAQIARLRIEAIERRPSVLVINTAPAEVNVRLEGERGEVVEGQAPNNFEVPHGRYRLTLSKPRYRTETLTVEVDIAETRPLFVTLDRVPAQLEVRTVPANATLFVRGNRTQNPYVQDVEAGTYELYAEATHHEARRDVVTLAPGERRVVELQLTYVQRSGRPELIGFWTSAGALAGGAAVLARLSTPDNLASFTASATVVAAGGIVGGVAGAIGSAAFVPDYIRDNLALFRIGAMWIGAAEGATLALSFRPSVGTGWMGGALGLAGGAVLGARLDHRAPNYGRVAVIQSGAAFGALAGMLAVPAFHRELGLSRSGLMPRAAFVGLNLGLASGLALAYGPDQAQYGPTWRRVMLVDLAGAAGAFAGALVDTMGRCIRARGNGGNDVGCEFGSRDSLATSRTAKFALVGGGVGLVAGWLLTRGYDRHNEAPSERAPTGMMPVPTAMPVAGPDGRTRIVPGFAAQGRF